MGHALRGQIGLGERRSRYIAELRRELRVISGYHAVQRRELGEIPSERAELMPLFDELSALFAEGAIVFAKRTGLLA